MQNVSASDGFEAVRRWSINGTKTNGWWGGGSVCKNACHIRRHLNPRHSCKNLGMAICAWKLSTMEGGDKRIVGCQSPSTFSERSCLNGIQQRVIAEDTPCLPLIIGVHWDVPHYVHTHTYVHIHAPLPHIQMLKAEQTEFLVPWEVVLILSHQVTSNCCGKGAK